MQVIPSNKWIDDDDEVFRIEGLLELRALKAKAEGG